MLSTRASPTSEIGLQLELFLHDAGKPADGLTQRCSCMGIAVIDGVHTGLILKTARLSPTVRTWRFDPSDSAFSSIKGSSSSSGCELCSRCLLGNAERPIAADGDSMAISPVRPVVEDRLVLSATIVPERDRVLLPSEPARQLRRLDVLKQEREQRIALRLAQLHDARRESAINKQQLATSDRMDADHRVLEARKLHVAALAGLSGRMRLPGIMDRG